MTIIGTPTTRRPRNAVIAAASRRTIQQLANLPTQTSDSAHLWDLYDRLGELGYGVRFKANAASRLTYYPALRVADDQDPEPQDNPPSEVQEAFDRLQGPAGDVADMVAEFSIHLDVTGEGYLVGTAGDDDDTFDVLSTEEIDDLRKNRRLVNRHPDAVEVPDDPYILRVWRPHPRQRQLADSPLKHVQSEAEQLVLLSDMVTALTRSRLPSQWLFIPDELSFASTSDRPETGANADEDPFMAELIQTVTEAIREPRSAARVAPIVIRGPGQYGEQIRVFDTARDLPEHVTKLIEVATRRLATGLDIPSDILLGLSDVNHWTAWQIDESAYKQHVDPLVLTILDSLTRGYLWPTLEEAGFTRARDWVLWRDHADLTARQQSPEEARGLFDSGIISAEAVRRVTGYNDTDAPTEPPPNPRGADGRRPVNVPGPPADDQPAQPAMVAAATQTVTLTDLAQIDATLIAELAEACQAAVDRALERAGAKIRSNARKDRGVTALIDGVDNLHVAGIVGPALVQRLQLTDDELVPTDTFTRLADRVRTRLTRATRDTSAELSDVLGRPVEPSQESESWIRRAVDALIAGLTALTLRRLYTPTLDPDPAETGEVDDTIVPTTLIFDTLTIAAGGTPQTVPDPLEPRGLALGQYTHDQLAAASRPITGWEWEYGNPFSRRSNFEPHRLLDGATFTSWTDQQLTNTASPWLSVSHYFPGDHSGCRCQAVPIIVA